VYLAGVLFGVLFIPTILAGILPQTWQNRIAGYLPMNAGDAIYFLHRETGSLAPWAGFGVFCGYAAVALGLGFVLACSGFASLACTHAAARSRRRNARPPAAAAEIPVAVITALLVQFGSIAGAAAI
jgi:hypothetical protein